MANCYLQIRCGIAHREMVVGREYDFSVGSVESKLSPLDFLEFVEMAVQRAIREKYGDMLELAGKQSADQEG